MAVDALARLLKQLREQGSAPESVIGETQREELDTRRGERVYGRPARGLKSRDGTSISTSLNNLDAAIERVNA